MHVQFEWDADKAGANRGRHKVGFDDAARILADDQGDRFQLELEDDRIDYGELRIKTLTPDPNRPQKIYVIVWTPRGVHGQITPIISARPADPKERRIYAQHQRL